MLIGQQPAKMQLEIPRWIEKRELYAALAMQANLVNMHVDAMTEEQMEVIATSCVKMSDQLIKALSSKT